MKTRAFTLIELLVSVSIVAALAALIFSAVWKAKRSAAMTREISAGRQLIGGYHAAAIARNGEFLVGYAAREGAVDEEGKDVPNPSCGRYPWRLAPYLDYRIDGVLLVNDLEKITAHKKNDREGYVYRVSAHPSLGINATFVGGNERTGLIPSPATKRRYGEFVATRMAQVADPSRLIVFASARFSGQAVMGDAVPPGEQPGFHMLKPPRTTRIEWPASYNERNPAELHGFIAPRYDGRAVCAMLDGHVELLTYAQLLDMRYWSHLAAEADDPNFTLKPQTSQ